MSEFTLELRFPGGGPSVGGVSAAPVGFHACHAQLPDGRPYIPATALRGALRETLEMLLRGSGEHRACAGGDGIDPGAERSAAPDEQSPRSAPLTCELGADGKSCLACRLFGTRRPSINAHERAFSGLILGDALPDGEPSWAARPSVAIDRSHRSAADHHLIMRRVPVATDAGPLTFTTHGRLCDPALAPYLEAAVRATIHIGAGRSRGLARVELGLSWNETAKPAEHALPGDGDALVRVTLTSPALVGASIVDGNYRETREEIPGSTLRGAVGFALRELLDDPDGDQAMQDLCDEDHGARFGFLYPADSAKRPAGSAASLPGPLPITANACKRAGRKHGVIDSLLDRLVLLHATSAHEAGRAAGSAPARCGECQAPLRTAQGSRRAKARPAKQTITRVSMDRTRQSARDGQLFSQVLLARDTVLEGTIRDIPPQSRTRLARALASGRISFGRGRSAGWGKAQIEVTAAPALPSLESRAQSFDRALADKLRAAGLQSDRVGRLVPITLLSPLWPSEDGDRESGGQRDGNDGDGSRELCSAIGAASCFLAARRFAREGTWDQRRGEMITFRATAAGAVFVLDLREGTWRDVLDRLASLERAGIGKRRDQGYGQLICFDPHFTEQKG